MKIFFDGRESGDTDGCSTEQAGSKAPLYSITSRYSENYGMVCFSAE